MAKKSVRRVAGAARNFLAGLRKRMNAISDEDAAEAHSAKGRESEAGARSSAPLADVPTEDGQAISVAAGAATDAPGDGPTTTKPARKKEKGKILTSTESASQLSAPA
jgi:hypothetical protein